MKKSVGLTILLLLVSCGGNESPTAPTPPTKTIARVSFDSKCTAFTTYPAEVTMISVSTAFNTNEFSVWVGAPAIDVELPAGGAYRVSAWWGASIFQIKARWDFTVNITDHQVNTVILGCN